MEKISLTLRIPSDFHGYLSGTADAWGVSLNQLVLVACRGYFSMLTNRQEIERLNEQLNELMRENLQLRRLAGSAAPHAVRDSAPPPPTSETMSGGTPALSDSESDHDPDDENENAAYEEISRLAKLRANNARRHEKKPKKRRK